MLPSEEQSMQTHLWVVRPDQSLPFLLIPFHALPKPHPSPLVSLTALAQLTGAGAWVLLTSWQGFVGMQSCYPADRGCRASFGCSGGAPPMLVSKGRAHHDSLQSLQGPAETQSFALCALQARSMMNYMAWSVCNPSKQQRVRRKHRFPTFTKRIKAPGNNELGSLRWAQQVASFSYVIIRPLLVHGTTFDRILNWRNKCFALQYIWHFPEKSWGPVSFPTILEYDKVLSQVMPVDKPFIGFVHDEPQNSWSLSEMCLSAWGSIRGGEALGSKSRQQSVSGFWILLHPQGWIA